MHRFSTHLPTGKWWGLHRGVKFGQIKGHLLHEPLEWFTVKFVPDGLLFRHIPRVNVPVVGPPLVQILSIFIHPDLGNSSVVLFINQEK